MANESRYLGVNFDNLRKALFLMFFGIDEGRCDDFSSPKYKYIIPMQGNFDNPLQEADAKDTYIMYWIENDKSITQDDFVQIEDEGYNRQKCIASILIRTVGREAEDWIKTFRHLCKRKEITKIWSGVCNAQKLEFTMPIIPRKINFFGKNSQIAFDCRFKLYYDECISTGWKPLEGINFKIQGNLTVEGQIKN